jgi:hypothetical protein
MFSQGGGPMPYIHPELLLTLEQQKMKERGKRAGSEKGKNSESLDG